MKTKETSRQIYITVVTSGLTMLANKVSRRLQPNEGIFNACSELANEIAKENGLEWSNVLVNYYNHYSDETPQFDNWRIPSKPKSTREQALAWWDNLTSFQRSYFKDLHGGNERSLSTLTGREIEEIWNREVNKECSKCKQTIENCECHIPYEVKHKDLIDFTKQLLGNSNQKQLPVICLNCKEIYNNPIKQCNCGSKSFQNTHPSNAKEFKQFDESLFRAYISKFSDEDLHKALILVGEKLNSNGYLKDFSYTQIKH